MCRLLTTTSFWQLRQPQQGVVTRNGLESDIGMPLVPATLAVLSAAEEALEAVGIQLLRLLRRDDADLVVLCAVLASRVADRVDMQARRCRLARQLTQSVDELLLQVVCQVVLLAEEYHTALRDCTSS